MSPHVSVVRVRDVLLMTVPSDPDDATISDLQAAILHSLEQHAARGVVLDIATVETMDSYFARTLAETADMVSLMGGETVIAGMRPGVAITATQLGLTFGTARAALDVDTAFSMLTEVGQGRR